MTQKSRCSKNGGGAHLDLMTAAYIREAVTT